MCGVVAENVSGFGLHPTHVVCTFHRHCIGQGLRRSKLRTAGVAMKMPRGHILRWQGAPAFPMRGASPRLTLERSINRSPSRNRLDYRARYEIWKHEAQHAKSSPRRDFAMSCVSQNRAVAFQHATLILWLGITCGMRVTESAKYPIGRFGHAFECEYIATFDATASKVAEKPLLKKSRYRPINRKASHEIDTQMTGKIWQVRLGLDHTPYAHVDFKRSHDHVDGYTVVTVDVDRFMTCFERDKLVIPCPIEWKQGKLEGIRDFLNPEGGACDMPVVGFSLRAVKRRRLWGILKPEIEKVPVAGFTNGRHRARYLQYAGAVIMPVEVHESEAMLLRKHCGVGT
ncbi:plasmid fertility inhibition factor family protein [Burkholderia catarinensis]|uniref:plasmid fertility inhibition factor family protein n=1 Tax=Burkholderia catarinensis TaxID=1108140 RepID=UPI00267D1927